MKVRVIDCSKRELLLDQIKKLDGLGLVAMPQGGDYNPLRGKRWTDRLTGKEYLRLLPSLLDEEDLGLSPQTVTIFDGILCNLGADGTQFAIDFAEGLVSSGHGYWFDRRSFGLSRSRRLAYWICQDEKFGALNQTTFGKEQVNAIGALLNSDDNLRSPFRNFIRRVRNLCYGASHQSGGRPKYDPTANWSVDDVPCRELLPQLSGLKRRLYGLLESACEVQEHADHYAQHRFKHPIYWMPFVIGRGSSIRDSAVKDVFSYACESLAMNAVILAVYACSLEGTEKDEIERREGYVFASSLNCLARAHALRTVSGPYGADSAKDFSVVSSPEFDRAYVEAYTAIGEKFKEIVHS